MNKDLIREQDEIVEKLRQGILSNNLSEVGACSTDLEEDVYFAIVSRDRKTLKRTRKLFGSVVEISEEVVPEFNYSIHSLSGWVHRWSVLIEFIDRLLEMDIRGSVIETCEQIKRFPNCADVLVSIKVLTFADLREISEYLNLDSDQCRAAIDNLCKLELIRSKKVNNAKDLCYSVTACGLQVAEKCEGGCL